MEISSGISTVWLFIHYSRSKWNPEMLVFAEGGKPKNPEKTPRGKDENQHAGSGNRTRATLVGGECFDHCAIPAPLRCVTLSRGRWKGQGGW